MLFCAIFVTLTISGEVKDIEVCVLAVQHAAKDQLSKPVRVALLALATLRRWVFIPFLVFTVPNLVAIGGGDALSICFVSSKLPSTV